MERIGDKMVMYNNRVIPEWLRITGTISSKKVIKKDLKKSVIQLTLDGNIVRAYGSITAASKAVGCSHSLIGKVLNGELKTAKGYKWERI